MLPIEIFIYVLVFILGITVGSFLNVCIYRLPLSEDIVKERSHCMHCGYQLTWYDMIPLFSWIALGGKCRKCRAKLSVQYPLVEFVNGVFWTAAFIICGISYTTIIYCVVISCLLVLSVIDARTLEIPFGINVMIFAMGVIGTIIDRQNLTAHLVGMLIVSVPLWLVYTVSGGRAIGGGDVKLMFGAGLLLGMSGIIIALISGCFIAVVIHCIRMKVSGAEHVLAMGPYLSVGILLAMWFGTYLTQWYMGLFY